MRSDFSKVVTERPRANRGPMYRNIRRGKGKYVYRADEDGEITPAKQKEGMRYPYGYDSKEFTDLLGPLVGFLHSRCGKPWSKVYSEVCANLKGRSTQLQHIIDHLKRMVETNLIIGPDGKLLHANKTPFLTWKDFYVDPRDGILKKVTERYIRRGWKTDKQKIKEMEDEVKTKDGQVFRKIEGLWFEVKTEQVEVLIAEGNAAHWHKANVEHKRQLGTAELKKRGLVNETET